MSVNSFNGEWDCDTHDKSCAEERMSNEKEMNLKPFQHRWWEADIGKSGWGWHMSLKEEKRTPAEREEAISVDRRGFSQWRHSDMWALQEEEVMPATLKERRRRAHRVWIWIKVWLRGDWSGPESSLISRRKEHNCSRFGLNSRSGLQGGLDWDSKWIRVGEKWTATESELQVDCKWIWVKIQNNSDPQGTNLQTQGRTGYLSEERKANLWLSRVWASLQIEEKVREVCDGITREEEEPAREWRSREWSRDLQRS